VNLLYLLNEDVLVRVERARMGLVMRQDILGCHGHVMNLLGE